MYVRYLLLTNDIFQTTNSCVPLLQFKTGFQLIHKIYAQGNLDYKENIQPYSINFIRNASEILKVRLARHLLAKSYVID